MGYAEGKRGMKISIYPERETFENGREKLNLRKRALLASTSYPVATRQMLVLQMARLAVSVRATSVGSVHGRAWPRLAGPVRSSGTTTTVVPGLCEIADRYDAVLLDQFGVLHDGQRSIDGAEDCFKRLAVAGKKLIVLSNTSRRRDFAMKRLPGLGFDPQALLGFVCSGEEAHAAMRESWRGRRVLWISWDDGCAP